MRNVSAPNHKANTLSHRIQIFLILSLLLSSCATQYQAQDDSFFSFGPPGGYIDKKIAEDTYEIMFEGNGSTPIVTVLNFWHRRAEELCKSNQYESEVIISGRGTITPEIKNRVNSIIVNHPNNVLPFAKGVAICRN